MTSDPRRLFLLNLLRLSSAATLATAFPGATIARTSSYPFRLGVASGAPLPGGVVLWTRLVDDDLLSGLPFSAHAVSVKWEVAEDESFRRIAASGMATALPELAHSVHVDAQGLRPDRWYWYRFMLGDAVSPVGRTRTAPPPTAMPSKLRVAVASCQHWEFGAYAAHRHIADCAPDLVAFLGDYIYEWGPYELTHPRTARRSDESRSLDEYRKRYAQYKSDPQLQEAHRVAPWIVTWDDHEVSNDYANDRDELLTADFLRRRAAAYQAFYEHMPLRIPMVKNAGFASLRMHQRLDWGRLARFHVLDDRQYRSHQACSPNGRGGSSSVTASCDKRSDTARTMLGAEQEAWLMQGFATSGARWNILAQQTLMAQASQLPVKLEGDGRFWTDGWDGYPAARQRLFSAMEKTRLANPVVLSGDVHCFYAAELQRDFRRPPSRDNPVIATEFCGTSVTSGSPASQARVERYVAHNPHLRYGRGDRRGYMLVDVAPSAMEVRFMGLDNVADPDCGCLPLAGFEVENGRPGVNRTA